MASSLTEDGIFLVSRTGVGFISSEVEELRILQQRPCWRSLRPGTHGQLRRVILQYDGVAD